MVSYIIKAYLGKNFMDCQSLTQLSVPIISHNCSLNLMNINNIICPISTRHHYSVQCLLIKNAKEENVVRKQDRFGNRFINITVCLLAVKLHYSLKCPLSCS